MFETSKISYYFTNKPEIPLQKKSNTSNGIAIVTTNETALLGFSPECIRQYVFNDDDDDVENNFEHISHIYDYSPV
ncbi:unnamed protein product [Rotaria sordida]|uniref:Uncharacterized protein n=1 Tax=Rotaria sordida TaxID=392033 RepID=A0A815VDX2_9BILA|nr:unnamed protein product [Rotaria sordida]CAF1534558.1 unnamed protein product [Rotaria sordida]